MTAPTATSDDTRTQEDRLADLDKVVAAGWARIHHGAFFRHVAEHGVTRELYRRTMGEMWHYIQQNPVNQAAAVVAVPARDTALVKYALDHAREELGHERMIEHDLRAVGLLDDDFYRALPLPATAALIAYLHHVSVTQGPVIRLGYSYWAESVYEPLAEILLKLRAELGLTDREMSFFVAHATIDEKHADDVRDALKQHATTAEQWRQVEQVARTTLFLNAAMLDNVLEEYLATDRS